MKKIVTLILILVTVTITVYGATLSQGSRGQEVIKLQQALKDKGYDITVDGVYGAKTREAVIKFQKDNGLTPDGIAGANTLSKLNLNVQTNQHV